VECETGKGSDALERRPQLAAALAHARRLEAPVLVEALAAAKRKGQKLGPLATPRLQPEPAPPG
jgi:hypothetical protein